MAKVEFVNFENVLREMSEYVAIKKIIPFLTKNLPEIQSIAATNILLSFEKTDVFRGLNGEFAGDRNRDIIAQLGLTEDIAKQSLDEMRDSIKTSFVASQVRGIGKKGRFAKVGQGLGFSFTIGSPALKNHIRAAVSQRSYKSAKAEIPWLDWLIDGDGTVDARITFNPDIVNRSKSRSSRAIMVKGGDWAISEFSSFSTGENFIIEALEDEEWFEKTEQEIFDLVRDGL